MFSTSDLSLYCCGIQWQGQEWVYAIVCCGKTLYLALGKFQTTNVLENFTVSTPAFELGNVVNINLSKQPIYTTLPTF
ncbi:Protein of unknown function DUF1392 [Nostoc flagelliforme CCNUN1]|uniref:Uncharacterized protein n=1 Tax=Nostoc flagelliforme CCNUN1 TaxID=2038116 RepID=A0A2K8SXQ2_9NOSO|nr:Protein of unknown function DUF1392 [Nostoc flagelliforme CCNUN1]